VGPPRLISAACLAGHRARRAAQGAACGLIASIRKASATWPIPVARDAAGAQGSCPAVVPRKSNSMTGYLPRSAESRRCCFLLYLAWLAVPACGTSFLRATAPYSPRLLKMCPIESFSGSYFST